MKQTSLPYLEFKTVKGREYIYFRRGKKRERLPGKPDTEEFSRKYWELRSGKATVAVRTSWNALIISYYQSPAFKSLSEGTRANYRRHCEAIREKNGEKDMRGFRRKHALAVQTALQATWSKANERIAVLSILCKHAVDIEWIDRNPVIDIPKLRGGEYEAWPDEKLVEFEQACERMGQTTARTLYELAIGTGQRLGDCIAMEWADFDGEYMKVVQEKTGAKIWIYCPARLQSFLSDSLRLGAHIMARTPTTPIGKRAAQKAVEDVRAEINAMSGDGRLVPHGWRYTAARQLAEAGCSDAEIQAVTGHKTLAMVQKYRSQANQKRASKRAQTLREQTTDE